MTALLFLILLTLLAAVARERRLRRAFTDDGAAFRCRLRPVSRRRYLLRSRWSRPLHARWCGDVLEIRRGPILDRTVRLAARVSPVGVYLLAPRDARRCGRRRGHTPIAVRLLVHDGTVVEVTTDRTDRALLVGPFLAAALSDLPKAPARRRET